MPIPALVGIEQMGQMSIMIKEQFYSTAFTLRKDRVKFVISSYLLYRDTQQTAISLEGANTRFLQ